MGDAYRKGYVYIQNIFAGIIKETDEGYVFAFFALAKSLEIPEKSAENMLKKICLLKDQFWQQCDEAYLSEGQREKVKDLIGQRTAVIA